MRCVGDERGRKWEKVSESEGEHVRAAVGERRVCADPVAHLQAPEPERVFVELLHRPSRTPRPARPRLVPSRFLGPMDAFRAFER